jgi:TPR repeat protein
MYRRGKGVLYDYKKAAELYMKAAAQGYARAQYGLGTMYGDGKA